MTPQTTHIRYAKRICPVQYEHEEMEVHFAVEANENLAEKTQTMKQFVHSTLYGRIANVNPSKGDDHAKQDNQKGDKKSSTEGKKTGGKSQGQEEVKTSASAQTEEMEEVPSPFKETSSEPSKEEAPKKESPKKETKKETKEIGVPYDSALQEHKSTLTNFLTKLTGGKEWAKDKEKSQKISREILHGKPFLDKSGKILPSFEALCKEQYGVGESADVL